MTALSVNVPRPIAHPDIPFDKLVYSIQLHTTVGATGQLQTSVQLTLRRGRVLPDGTWEIDSSPGKHVVKASRDVFALAAQYPAVAAAIDAMHSAVSAINAAEQLL